jgi:serine protease inhibitor
VNKYKVFLAVTVASMVALTSGCVNKNTAKEEDNNKESTSYTIMAKELEVPVDKISSSNNKVAFKFLSQVVKEKDNVVVSPLSMNTILSLTQNGASGKTKEEMLQALEMKGYEDKDINEGYKNVIAHFNNLKNVKVNMGNSVWITEGAQVRQEFKDIGKNFYEAQSKEVNFQKPKTVDMINHWISGKTAGKIKKIVDSFDVDTYMALINTVYFKGGWDKPFGNVPSEDKQARTFTLSDGSTKEVDTMNGLIEAEYLKESEFSAVRIPYKDNNFGMYIFLPNKESNLDSILKDMNLSNWNQWMKNFQKKSVIMRMPKFKIEYEKKLNDMLQGFGMVSAFKEDADFSKMTEKDKPYISLVKQKAYIDVNENGTEAAAVTAVIMEETSIMVEDPVEFTADRPFIFAIADKKTGLIMFVGKVEKP